VLLDTITNVPYETGAGGLAPAQADRGNTPRQRRHSCPCAVAARHDPGVAALRRVHRGHDLARRGWLGDRELIDGQVGTVGGGAERLAQPPAWTDSCLRSGRRPCAGH